VPLGRAALWLASRIPTLVFLAAIGSLLVWFFWSYDFYVYSAEIRGNSVIPSEAVFAQSGLEGYNIFYVDANEVERRIRELPAVKDVRVSFALPNQVAINLQERVPVAVWETQGQRYWVDKEGVFFPITSPPPTDTLVIRDLDNRGVRLGKPAENEAPPDPIPVRTALEISRYMPERRQFDYSRGRGISFETSGGWRVYFGDDVGLQAKVAVFQAFREKRAPYVAVEFLDLSIPGQPYYKKRGTATAVPAATGLQ